MVVVEKGVSMAFTVRFEGTNCALCGSPLEVGESADGRKGSYKHVQCPPKDKTTFVLEKGEGYGGAPFTVGDVYFTGGKVGSTRSKRAEDIDGLVAQRMEKWRQEHPLGISLNELYAEAPKVDSGLRYGSPEHKAALEALWAWQREHKTELDAYTERHTEHSEQERAARTAAWKEVTAQFPDDDGPQFVYVVRATSRYVREDGLSFGVGADSGHIYRAVCRAATEEEAAPVRAALEQKKAAAEKRKQLRALEERFFRHGEYVSRGALPGEEPEAFHALGGEEIPVGSGNTGFGGGRWFVIEADHIWHVLNNGADGDDWSSNNVRTGGAGAIGRRLPRTPELEAQVRELTGAGPQQGDPLAGYSDPA